jgi:hypothetical protein
MPGARNQFVLVSARKSRGGDWWALDDYDVQDSHGKVVGRIMLHPQAPKDQPWFWTITAREIPPSAHNRGYSAARDSGTFAGMYAAELFAVMTAVLPMVAHNGNVEATRTWYV